MQIAAEQQKQHTHIITHIFFILCHSVRAGAERAAGVPALPRSAAASLSYSCSPTARCSLALSECALFVSFFLLRNPFLAFSVFCFRFCSCLSHSETTYYHVYHRHNGCLVIVAVIVIVVVAAALCENQKTAHQLFFLSAAHLKFANVAF